MRTYLLPQIERDVFVLDHVLDLALHRNEEQHKEVQQQDGPEDWHVKHREEGGDHAEEERFGRRVPAPNMPILSPSPCPFAFSCFFQCLPETPK